MQSTVNKQLCMLNKYKQNNCNVSFHNEDKSAKESLPLIRSNLRHNIIIDPCENISTSPYILREIERYHEVLKGAGTIAMNS